MAGSSMNTYKTRLFKCEFWVFPCTGKTPDLREGEERYYSHTPGLDELVNTLPSELILQVIEHMMPELVDPFIGRPVLLHPDAKVPKLPFDHYPSLPRDTIATEFFKGAMVLVEICEDDEVSDIQALIDAMRQKNWPLGHVSTSDTPVHRLGLKLTASDSTVCHLGFFIEWHAKARNFTVEWVDNAEGMPYWGTGEVKDDVIRSLGALLNGRRQKSPEEAAAASDEAGDKKGAELDNDHPLELPAAAGTGDEIEIGPIGVVDGLRLADIQLVAIAAHGIIREAHLLDCIKRGGWYFAAESG